MVERLMILKTTPTDGRDNRLMKNDSLNTDDDDSVVSNDQQTNLSESQTSSATTTKDQLNLTTPQLQQTPSFEFSNDQDEDPTQIKVKKKKQRRMTDQTSGERRRSSAKHRPWYTKVDLTKPILFLLFICLIYLMWVKRDVWIPRLLTSNSRIRRLDLTKKDSNDDNHRSSISKNSNDKDSDDEENNSKEQIDDDDDDDDDDDHNNNDNDDDEHNDDDGESIKSKHKKSKAKLNVKARRNKMSFSKDGNERKNRPLKHKLIDDDDDDDDDDDKISPAKDKNDGDDDEDSRLNHRDHHTNKKEKKRSIEPIPSKSSSKSRSIRQERSKSSASIVNKSVDSKTNLLLSAKEDLIEQMKKLIQSRDRNKNIVKLLSKQTGLNKKKITKLIKEKDYRLITLENVISFLNRYHSTLVIVSK